MVSDAIQPSSNSAEIGPVPTPIVYDSEEKYQWEYKHLEEQLDREGPPTEDQLNRLGKENWELVSVFTYEKTAHFYFKRLKS